MAALNSKEKKKIKIDNETPGESSSLSNSINLSNPISLVHQHCKDELNKSTSNPLFLTHLRSSSELEAINLHQNLRGSPQESTARKLNHNESRTRLAHPHYNDESISVQTCNLNQSTLRLVYPHNNDELISANTRSINQNNIRLVHLHHNDELIGNLNELYLVNTMMNRMDDPPLRLPNSETIHNSNINVSVSHH